MCAINCFAKCDSLGNTRNIIEWMHTEHTRIIMTRNVAPALHTVGACWRQQTKWWVRCAAGKPVLFVFFPSLASRNCIVVILFDEIMFRVHVDGSDWWSEWVIELDLQWKLDIGVSVWVEMKEWMSHHRRGRMNNAKRSQTKSEWHSRKLNVSFLLSVRFKCIS